MSERAEGTKKEGKGKKPHKNKPTSQKYKHYKFEGTYLKKSKNCPRCGAGIFFAVHKDRVTCGKCKYTEFVKKS